LQALNAINNLIGAYEPMTRKESAYFGALMRKLDQTYDARRERVFRASAGIAPEIWTVTLAGGPLLAKGKKSNASLKQQSTATAPDIVLLCGNN
jgi:hypothetical protein